MLNRNKAAREAARVLLGLSLSHFDGEDTQKAESQTLAGPNWRQLAWFAAGIAFLAFCEWVTKRWWS
jgi:hypothetical protein